MTAPALRLTPGREVVDDLRRCWPHAAGVVRAISRRRDVRDTRARILLLLWSMRCPVEKAPSRRWYVPGAVARLGNDGLRRAWRYFYGCEAPADRTIRNHLAVLQDFLLIVRAPGEQLPRLRNPEAPHHRPRYPDAFHLLDTERESDWWAHEGRHLAQQHPKARWDARAWRKLFGAWRVRAVERKREPLLPFPDTAPPAETREPRRGRRPVPAVTTALALELAKLARRRDLGGVEHFLALRRLGVDVRGVHQVRLAGQPDRLREATAMLARALDRGDDIRRMAAWLVRIAQTAPPTERRAAVSWCATLTHPQPRTRT